MSISLKSNIPAVAHHGKTVIGFNIINGKEVEGDVSLIEARSAVDSRDVVGMFPESGEKDVARAAGAAAEAFKSWRAVPAPVRAALLGRFCDIVEKNRERFAKVITREVGKPHREALGEVQEVVDTCRFFQGEGRRLHGQTVPSELPMKELTTFRRPVGVCGVLVSGCFPLALPAWKIIPAILCGNTVVWKPSENAPTIAYLFVRAMMDAGLPPGVVNVVNGRGRTGVGRHLLAALDKGLFQQFSFTGSTEMGRTVGEICGRNLIRPTLELGAKNPMIVMADADLDNAVRGALWAAFGTAGQRCTSLGNLLLHAPIAQTFRDKFMAGVEAIQVGNPIQHPEVMYGPLMSRRHLDAFLDHVARAEADPVPGARRLSGGARWDEGNRTSHVLGTIEKGGYVQPTVWEGVTPEHWLFQNEIFGPTVNLCVVQDFDQALAWANGTPYGLSSSLYTENRRWIARFKQEISAGMSSINASTTGAEDHMPFGGNGWSGNGSRACGSWALEEFTRWHAVNDDASGRLQLAQIETDYGSGAPKPVDWTIL